MIVISVPQMECRHDVRSISASIADLQGVDVLQVDLTTKTVRIEGDVSADAVRAAIAGAGYLLTA